MQNKGKISVFLFLIFQQFKIFIILMLKENTCENNGLCYLNGEVSHNMLDLDGKPVLNAFVCASNISQRGLYMPCAKENGGCKYEQICNFNATTLEVSCN